MNGESPSTHPSASEPVLVLIVDDEQSIAETLADVVVELGYTPLIAANGRQALDLARERWPTLVITDLMMPHMNGADLITALRAEAAARRLAPPRVLLLTAAGARAVAGARADATILKPFDLDHLERVVRRLLDSSHP